jgi:MoaA/NifB/PqqE/SkfB family radical SAM enzyme
MPNPIKHLNPRTSSPNSDRKTFSPANYAGESIDLYVNSTCNLKCQTCFLGDEYFKISNNISVDGAEAVLKWAYAARVHDVAFLGGEPSLHPHIGDLLKLAHDIGIPANRFITNGTRPFQRLLSSVAARHLDLVYVSLDGPTEQSNDLVRGKGVFRQATRTMSLLRDSDIPFVITSSIAPESYSEITSLLDFAENSGCRTLNIHWVSPTGRARDGTSSVAPDAWASLCRQVMNHRIERSGFSIQCQPAYWRADLQDLDPPVQADACAVRERTNLQFMPDGSVYACGLLVDRRGLNGYEWNGDSLTMREGVTELSICLISDGRGCPVRHDVVCDPSTDGAQHIPLCIYQRVYNADN